MAESAPSPARKLVYLQPVGLANICFLQEVLYWVAFGRMPVADISRDYFADCDDRDTFIEGYKTDVPYANGELTEGECDRAGLPRDPRLNYDWAWNVMLSDQIKEIVASRELIDVETEQNESVRKEQASSDAAKLLDEISEWKPKFERAIELAASEVYTVLRKGLLISRGVRLPDPDVAISLKVLAKWEISATRNDREHYCHIHCLTDEVMFLFPLETVTTGESVDGLVRHGSFFVLSQNSAAAATLPRRSQARGRRGRPREYRWNDLHVEMAALVREGLPAKKDAAVEHLRELYRTRCGEPVPANRTLYDWVKPYYERYCRNSDR